MTLYATNFDSYRLKNSNNSNDTKRIRTKGIQYLKLISILILIRCPENKSNKSPRCLISEANYSSTHSLDVTWLMWYGSCDMSHVISNLRSTIENIFLESDWSKNRFHRNFRFYEVKLVLKIKVDFNQIQFSTWIVFTIYDTSKVLFSPNSQNFFRIGPI